MFRKEKGWEIAHRVVPRGVRGVVIIWPCGLKKGVSLFLVALALSLPCPLPELTRV